MVMTAQAARWAPTRTPTQIAGCRWRLTRRCLAIHDAWNRLVEVYTYVGGPPTTFGKYRYDGLHRRIWRIVDGFGDPNRTDYYYNTSWQVLEECFYDGENPETTVATDVTCQYVWDPRYIDAPVCRDEDVDDDDDCTETDWDTGDDPDEHLYYCQDANFNTTALVERSDGTVVERYSYDPYGKVTIYDDDWSDTVTWANSKKNEVLYCGYRYDHESRLYHVRNRSYHPTLGRWMQRDPIGYVDGMGLYEYVGSEPVAWTDPSGLTEYTWDLPHAAALAWPPPGFRSKPLTDEAAVVLTDVMWENLYTANAKLRVRLTIAKGRGYRRAVPPIYPNLSATLEGITPSLGNTRDGRPAIGRGSEDPAAVLMRDERGGKTHSESWNQGKFPPVSGDAMPRRQEYGSDTAFFNTVREWVAKRVDYVYTEFEVDLGYPPTEVDGTLRLWLWLSDFDRFGLGPKETRANSGIAATWAMDYYYCCKVEGSGKHWRGPVEYKQLHRDEIRAVTDAVGFDFYGKLGLPEDPGEMREARFRRHIEY
jgi:RHS repeat-associated protein